MYCFFLSNKYSPFAKSVILSTIAGSSDTTCGVSGCPLGCGVVGVFSNNV
jgi:hypothetical protein